jgi:hypothetical protein
MDVPGYPTPLLITDAAINIAPTLEEKADIIRNAIDLAHDRHGCAARGHPGGGGDGQPRHASTLDAAALCKMADRGQITGAVLDGPLAFDNAISPAAARKRASSPVAGRRTSWWCPIWKRATCWPSSSPFWAGRMRRASCWARGCRSSSPAGPTLRTRLASCAVGVLLARARRAGGKPAS